MSDDLKGYFILLDDSVNLPKCDVSDTDTILLGTSSVEFAYRPILLSMRFEEFRTQAIKNLLEYYRIWPVSGA